MYTLNMNNFLQNKLISIFSLAHRKKTPHNPRKRSPVWLTFQNMYIRQKRENGRRSFDGAAHKVRLTRLRGGGGEAPHLPPRTTKKGAAI